VNARIAEESKLIAAEARKDSSSMKTIAALTMVFLPGAFIAVSSVSIPTVSGLTMMLAGGPRNEFLPHGGQ
jgi:hypothetical protein